jgi:hypothetical protein
MYIHADYESSDALSQSADEYCIEINNVFL